MDLNEFKDSLAGETLPAGVSPKLQAMWHEAKGDWEAAHHLVQNQNDRDGAWVHAYLHRKEGDNANAGYWYSRAGRPASQQTLEQEWAEIVEELLKRNG
jgi:hypothetical protein